MADDDHDNLFRSNETWTEPHINPEVEDLVVADDADVHPPVQVESSVSCDGEVIHFSSVRTTGDVQPETQEHYVTENVGSYAISIRTGFTQLFHNLTTDINELKEVVYKHFLTSILKSSSGDSSGLEPQIPIFVVEIMAQKSASDLFHLLKSKTPYCDIFNFLDFIENITNKIDNEEAKKIVSCSKKAIFRMKKDEIISYMEKEHPEREGFSKVVLQMDESFDICSYGEIRQLKKQTSFILQLQNLVCFVACDEEHQTVTYLIPSIFTEGACRSAQQVAHRFVYNGILHITIGGRKILNVQHEPILQKQQSLHLDISSMKIKINVCLKVSYSIEVKLSYTIALVKWIIYQLLYIPPSMQALRYHEESLENDRTVQSYKIKEHDTIVLMPELKEIYDDMIKLLPSNCQYAVAQWKQSFSEVEGIFHTLSQTYDDHVRLYENLLPFVFEKCGYHVLQFIDVAMKAIRDEKKRKKIHELRNGISQLKDTSGGGEIDSNLSVGLQSLTLTESARNIQSGVQKPNESAPASGDTQLLGVVTDVQPKCEPSQSGGHHVPHVVETAEVKDGAKSSPQSPEKEDVKAELEMQSNNMTENQPNTTKPHSPESEVSKLPTSLPDDTSLPDNLVSSEDFIEVKLHYDTILRLMPKDYGYTLERLREDITDDEMAPIVGIGDPDLANKKILNCLINKLKNREQMLDFCDQLEKVITSQDLKAIIDEIKSGVQQGMQFSTNSESTHTQSVAASTHQAPTPSHLFKCPLCLQPPKLPMNFVQRPEHLNVIVSKLCNPTSNLNVHNKVIGVTGVGGFGKTTIVTGLCHDPRVKDQFTGGVLFIELGAQATDPKVKLNEIYCSIVGEGIENINKVETEIANIFKENFLVVIDDVWDAKDAELLIKAFRNCHVVFTARRNDIAQKLTIAENIVRIGPMKIDEAIILLSRGLFDLNKISCDNKELLKDLARDAHMWPILLCLVRGQVNHHLKLNISVDKAIKTVQHKLRDRGLTAFDKSDIESAKTYKSVSIYMESTLELLPKDALNRFVTLILFTGIGGIFYEAALSSLWDSSDLEAKKVVKTLFDYGLLSCTDIFTSQYLKNQSVVHTHGVISQYMFDNVRSDQVATLSPFGLLHTNNSVSDKLESLFRNSYLQHDLSELTPREYLRYTMLKIEHVVIPFQLKRITAHILHDPHYILLMIQRIHNTICASVNHMQIITQVSEQIVTLDSKCKKALKDAQVSNRIINSEVQHFLFMRDYDKLEKTLEEHCTAFSNGKIAQSCIELVNQIIPMCEDSVLESFDFVRQMLTMIAPPHHFITMEKLPVMKLYIGLHKDIVSSLSTGSTDLYKMYTYTTSGDFNKKLDSVSSDYSSKLEKIAPVVISSSLAMFKK